MSKMASRVELELRAMRSGRDLTTCFISKATLGKPYWWRVPVVRATMTMRSEMHTAQMGSRVSSSTFLKRVGSVSLPPVGASSMWKIYTKRGKT